VAVSAIASNTERRILKARLQVLEGGA